MLIVHKYIHAHINNVNNFCSYNNNRFTPVMIYLLKKAMKYASKLEPSCRHLLWRRPNESAKNKYF